MELRIDCLRRDPDLKRILKDRPTPMVFTIRRGVDGGLWRGNEEKRQQLLREAIALGVDYVDLEMDIAPKIRRFGKTKRIVSYHNLKATPVDVQDIAEKCEEADPDIVKVATAADDPGRGVAGAPARRRRASSRRSPSRWARSGSSPGSWAPSSAPRSPTPASTPSGSSPRGCSSSRSSSRTTSTTQIDAKTEVYGVIGDPIEQSLSPAIHNAAFRHLGLNKVLVPFLVPERRARGVLPGARLAGDQGHAA